MTVSFIDQYVLLLITKCYNKIYIHLPAGMRHSRCNLMLIMFYTPVIQVPSQKFIFILYVRQAPQDHQAAPNFRNSNRPPPLWEFTSFLIMYTARQQG